MAEFIYQTENHVFKSLLEDLFCFNDDRMRKRPFAFDISFLGISIAGEVDEGGIHIIDAHIKTFCCQCFLKPKLVTLSGGMEFRDEGIGDGEIGRVFIRDDTVVMVGGMEIPACIGTNRIYPAGVLMQKRAREIDPEMLLA